MIRDVKEYPKDPKMGPLLSTIENTILRSLKWLQINSPCEIFKANGVLDVYDRRLSETSKIPVNFYSVTGAKSSVYQLRLHSSLLQNGTSLDRPVYSFLIN